MGSSNVLWAAVVCSLGAMACGGPTVSPDSGIPPGDAAMPDSSAPIDAGMLEDTRLFVPDIPNTYDGPILDPGVELLTFTIREDSAAGAQYLAALRNTSTDLRLCALDLTTRFFDATGAEIAIASGLVETPPARGVSGTGGLTNCLLPGQIGMQAASLDLGAAAVSDIVSATWAVGGLNLTDSVATDDLQVIGITAVPDSFGGSHFTGAFRNNGSTTVTYPQVSIFGVTTVGRPLFESGDISSVALAPGSSWTFDTAPSFDEPYASAVAFPEGNE